MFASALVIFVAGGMATVSAASAAPAPTAISPLAFVEPGDLVGTHFHTGEHINITWTTPFVHTTLTVWQGPFADGSYKPSILADKWTQDRTHVVWKASPLTDDPRHGFHFELRKGNKPNDCAACVVNTNRFAIAQQPLNPSSSTSSLASTTSSHSHSKTTSSQSRTSTSTSISSSSTSASSFTPTSTPIPLTTSTSTPTSSVSSTTIGVADANALTTTSAAPSYIPDSTNSEHGLAVGLAVGFGTGVPIIIALYAILLFFYTRAQRRTQSVRLPSIEDDAERLNEKQEPRSATNSWISKWSDASIFTQATTYHEPFEFQHPDGSKRPGSERLFRKGEQIPGSPGRVFQR